MEFAEKLEGPLDIVYGGYLWNSYESFYFRLIEAETAVGLFISARAKKPRDVFLLNSVASIEPDVATNIFVIKLKVPSTSGKTEYRFQVTTDKSIAVDTKPIQTVPKEKKLSPEEEAQKLLEEARKRKQEEINQFRTKIPSWPEWDEEDVTAVTEVIRSGKWWSGSPSNPQGQNYWKFQKEFAQFSGSRHAFACTNGSHAVEVALMALGISLGDEVIVSDFGFVGSASAIIANNAVPIFCDVDPLTYNMDVNKVEALITPRTKAILAVHLAGMPLEMDRVLEIANKHSLKVVEDCSHSHGSLYRGRYLGNWAHVGCFSFQGDELLSAGEGGALVCNSDSIAKRIYSILDCGREAEGGIYDHLSYGSNYRMPELTAALLRTQMKKFYEQSKRREANAMYFAQKLSAIEGMHCQERTEGVEFCGYSIFIVRFDPVSFGAISKSEIYEYLKENGIPTVVSYPPLHSLSVFKEIKLKRGIDYSHANWGGQRSDNKFFPIVTDIYNHCIEFPQNLLLAEREQLDYVVEKILELREKVKTPIK